MSTRRNLSLLMVGLTLVVVTYACGVFALEGAGAPPPVEEPAAPSEPKEPAAEEPPEPEPPAPTAVQPTLSPLPTSTPAGLSPLSTPTLVGEIPVTGGGVEKSGPAPAIPESRRLTLEFPPLMRTGDSTRIRLQLEVDDRGGIVPTAVVEGNVVTGEVVEIPNLYETHNVIAEARLDMAGMQIQPPGTISEPLKQGRSVTFFWSVRPEDSGTYQGTAWLHLRFVPRSGGEESRIPVSVQFLEIEAKSFLGFVPGGTARGLGALGSVVGSVLGFPFVGDIVKWFLRRVRRK